MLQSKSVDSVKGGVGDLTSKQCELEIRDGIGQENFEPCQEVLEDATDHQRGPYNLRKRSGIKLPIRFHQ